MGRQTKIIKIEHGPCHDTSRHTGLVRLQRGSARTDQRAGRKSRDTSQRRWLMNEVRDLKDTWHVALWAMWRKQTFQRHEWKREVGCIPGQLERRCSLVFMPTCSRGPAFVQFPPWLFLKILIYFVFSIINL